MSHFTLSSTVTAIPDLPYQDMKDASLGVRYDLSLALVGPTRARTINQRTRQKDYTPNVLSFPLTPSAGEIYLCPAVAKREAKAFGRTYPQQLAFLYIHGLLHLKGHDHGATMEKLEARWCRHFQCESTLQ